MARDRGKLREKITAKKKWQSASPEGCRKDW